MAQIQDMEIYHSSLRNERKFKPFISFKGRFQETFKRSSKVIYKKRKTGYQQLEIIYKELHNYHLAEIQQVFCNQKYLKEIKIISQEYGVPLFKISLKQTSNKKQVYGILKEFKSLRSMMQERYDMKFIPGLKKLKRHITHFSLILEIYLLKFFLKSYLIQRFYSINKFGIQLDDGSSNSLEESTILSLFRNRNLQYLRLNLITLGRKTENIMFSANSFMGRMKKLKSLELHINSNGTQIVDLSQKLKNLCNLEQISLDFLNCWNHLSKTESIQFISNITSIQSLNSLSLQFSLLNKEGKENINALIQQLYLAKNLSTLKLQFRSCVWISDTLPKEIAQQLALFKKIETLELGFPWCENIPDDGVINLCHVISTMTNLQSLKLEFDSCNPLTDKSLLILGETLNNLNQLIKLSLDFSRCSQLTDFGVLAISASILNIPNLKFLGLCFSNAQKITVQVRSSINQQIKRKKGLAKIKFVFLCCGEVPKQIEKKSIKKSKCCMM